MPTTGGMPTLKIGGRSLYKSMNLWELARLARFEAERGPHVICRIWTPLCLQAESQAMGGYDFIPSFKVK